MQTWRVGVIGAGAVAQAIHLPTIAMLGEDVRVTAVMDPDGDLATTVAEPWKAHATTDLDELLASGVDIVVIGSPPAAHAAQIEAACAAGVRGILAEKPLAEDAAGARRVGAAVKKSNTALVVGAMHTYDPAWLATLPGVAGHGPYHVRSAIHIPPNPHFEDMAASLVRPPRAAVAGPPPGRAQRLRDGILGLAIHDLPLIRPLVPVLRDVRVADTVDPWGYVITAYGDAGTVELLARTGGTWRPDWTLDIWGDGVAAHVSFPPSYVHAGSATAVVRDADGARVFGPSDADGYLLEWRELLAMMGGALPRYDVEHIVDDVAYAFEVADMAARPSADKDVA